MKHIWSIIILRAFASASTPAAAAISTAATTATALVTAAHAVDDKLLQEMVA